MFNPLHSISDVRKTPLQSMHTERNGAAHTSYINYCLTSEVSIRCVVGYVQPVTQQYEIRNCSKSISVIKTGTMKNTDNFGYEGKPSHVIVQSTLFAASKNEWDTKKDTGKSMKNALYVLWYAKRHLSG